MIAILFIISACVLFALAAVGVAYSKKEETEIYEQGISTIGVVVDPSKITGKNVIQDDIYVKYKDDNGEYQIGKLNFPGIYQVGKQINIKFMPGNYNEVVFMSDHIDELLIFEEPVKSEDANTDTDKNHGAIK